MEEKKYRYFITGGGTGGHIYPAVAVAEALAADKTTEDIYYVGNPHNLEYDIVKQKGYKFLGVNVHGMPRKIGFAWIKWIFQLSIAVLKCKYYLWKYKPDVIFGTGGYVSAPVLLATKLSYKNHIPYMLHDCDANPGLVSRKLSKDADAVSLAFECAKERINNENCFINGNPIRDEFKTLSKEDARLRLGLKNKLTVCIMGGSQGAKSINSAAIGILKRLSEKYDVQVIFQTGKKNFAAVASRLKEVYPEYENDNNLLVRPYFDDMVTVLKASDIAVSRAGSLSISELCASGVVSILVPYPHAAADHQRKNARFMEEKGAAIYLEDSDTRPEKLLEFILTLIEKSDKMNTMRENVLKLAKYDGTEKIVEQLKDIVKKKG